jgi:hypothetical protein
LRSVNAEIQSFADKFPVQRNREFSNVLQGRFFDKQGNYRSAEHADEPAGDVRFQQIGARPAIGISFARTIACWGEKVPLFLFRLPHSTMGSSATERWMQMTGVARKKRQRAWPTP